MFDGFLQFVPLLSADEIVGGKLEKSENSVHISVIEIKRKIFQITVLRLLGDSENFFGRWGFFYLVTGGMLSLDGIFTHY